MLRQQTAASSFQQCGLVARDQLFGDSGYSKPHKNCRSPSRTVQKLQRDMTSAIISLVGESSHNLTASLGLIQTRCSSSASSFTTRCSLVKYPQSVVISASHPSEAGHTVAEKVCPFSWTVKVAFVGKKQFCLVLVEQQLTSTASHF